MDPGTEKVLRKKSIFISPGLKNKLSIFDSILSPVLYCVPIHRAGSGQSNFRIIYINQYGSKWVSRVISGLKIGSPIGLGVTRLFGIYNSNTILSEFTHVIDSGKKSNFELHDRTNSIAVSVSKFELGILVSWRKIGSKAEIAQLMEDQQKLLIRSSKLTALGQMASGISHEIATPLTVIYGNACLLGKLVKKNSIDLEKMDVYISEIQATSKRIEKIIEGLRAFSREGGHEEFEPSSMSAIVEDTLRFCERRIRRNGIDLRVEGVQLSKTVNCRPVQISEILLNLLNNACDAVIGQSSPWIFVSILAQDNFVDVAIMNSGPKIGNDVQAKMFQPFYTTKPRGQGTGLGLSLSKELAEANQGTLFYDALTEYTRFVLRLPILESVP